MRPLSKHLPGSGSIRIGAGRRVTCVGDGIGVFGKGVAGIVAVADGPAVGAMVDVGTTSVGVGVEVGGTDVEVGGTGVGVGGTDVGVGGTDVGVGGTGVGVGSTSVVGVEVGLGSGVWVAVGVIVELGVGVAVNVGVGAGDQIAANFPTDLVSHPLPSDNPTSTNNTAPEARSSSFLSFQKSKMASATPGNSAALLTPAARSTLSLKP